MLIPSLILSQNTILDAYVYESNNRGYLNQVLIQILNKENQVLRYTIPNYDVHFTLDLEIDKATKLITSKEGFENLEIELNFGGN